MMSNEDEVFISVDLISEELVLFRSFRCVFTRLESPCLAAKHPQTNYKPFTQVFAGERGAYSPKNDDMV